MVWRQASRMLHGVVGPGVARLARQYWRATVTSAMSKSKVHGSTKWLIALLIPLLWLVPPFFPITLCHILSLPMSLPALLTLAKSCWTTVASRLPIDLALFVSPLFLWTKSGTELSNPDLRSNPRPRTRLSAGGVAAVMCPQVAQTSVRSVTHVAKAERQAGGRRRPKKSPSSGAGRMAATTTPTKRNRATAMSVTTLNRSIAPDNTHVHTCNNDNEDTSLAL